MNSEQRLLQRRELRRLVAELCDGVATEAGCRRLDELIRSSSELRQEYLSLVEVHDELMRVDESNGGPLVQSEGTSTKSDAAVAMPTGFWSGAVNTRWSAAMIAASALVVMGTFWLFKPSAEHGQPLVAEQCDLTSEMLTLVGEVTEQSSDSNWFIERRGQSSAGVVYQGDALRLSSGRIRVSCSSGAEMTLEAPSFVEFVNPMRVRAVLGSLKVAVADGVDGFTVATPVADVVDRGTVFGVSVQESGQTNVAVFSGMVDIASKTAAKGDGRSPKRLRTGEAVGLDKYGTMSRIVTITNEDFPDTRVESVVTRPPVIVAAWDNIERSDNYSFYEIVHGGMREDASAYVDRLRHEWNGIDKRGMPAYLLGGDYIKMFNDDKINESVSLTLELVEPAYAYILLDDEVSPPEWLKREFEDTGDVIGMDLGPYLHADGKMRDLKNGVGPGLSIDRPFSIWRRYISKAGTVTLGPNASEPMKPSLIGQSMYGVVVVPERMQENIRRMPPDA